jgi:hypothetical protein
MHLSPRLSHYFFQDYSSAYSYQRLTMQWAENSRKDYQDSARFQTSALESESISRC